MEWEISTSGRAKSYKAAAEVATWDELAKSLTEWLGMLFEQIMALAPDYRWDRLVIEQWIDSGRLLAYPALASRGARDRPVSVEIAAPFLASELELIPEDDPERVDQISSLEYQTWNHVRKAFRDREVKKLLTDLRKRKVFKIWRQSGDGSLDAGEFLV
jgi:hypothetical protein